MRSSLRVRFTDNSEKAIGKDVFTDVKYAIYQEKGTGIYAVDKNGRKSPWVYMDENKKWHRTRGNKPHPFLLPAFKAESKQLLANLRQILR